MNADDTDLKIDQMEGKTEPGSVKGSIWFKYSVSLSLF